MYHSFNKLRRSFSFKLVIKLTQKILLVALFAFIFTSLLRTREKETISSKVWLDDRTQISQPTEDWRDLQSSTTKKDTDQTNSQTHFDRQNQTSDEIDNQKTSGLPSNHKNLEDSLGHYPFLDCSGVVTKSDLPYAPAAFYPNVSNWKQKEIHCQPEQLWNTQCCKPVYFLGSGKCGSTTLAMLLKHKIPPDYLQFDETTGFADGGKEPCWALSGSWKASNALLNKFPHCRNCSSSSPQRLVLDGCPRYGHTNQQARAIYCSDPNAKFVMMVREPTTTAISDHNDNHIIRGSSARTESAKQTLSADSIRRAHFYSILHPFLDYFPPENILIVQLEYLKNESYLQHIMTAVQDHYQAPRRNVRPIRANNNEKDKKYTLPSFASLKNTISQLCLKNFQFYDLIGYRMDWMHHITDVRTGKFVNSNVIS